MMYYRRKILLALIQAFDGSLNKTELQKYLFLFSQHQKNPSYEFVPYKYGCFSFQSLADKKTLTKYGYLSLEDRWVLVKKNNYLELLNEDDKHAMRSFKLKYGSLKGNMLLKYIYTNYPYYAINSQILDSVLTHDQKNDVIAEKPSENGSKLFTIGYEGKTLEHFLNQLLRNNVKILCDVRKNALSMKFGFSKNQLKNALEKLEIKYVHIPELGIDSNKRKNLDTKENYNNLFEDYSKNQLPNQTYYLNKIITLLETDQRVALTCFEICHTWCHRSKITEALSSFENWNYKIEHL